MSRVDRFENAQTERDGVHYSRYIVSWLKMVMRHKDILSACNRVEIIFGDDFESWLRLEGLTEDEISNVIWMATNGKLELELSAGLFIG